MWAPTPSNRSPPPPKRSQTAKHGVLESDGGTRFPKRGRQSVRPRRMQASWMPWRPRASPIAIHMSRSSHPPLFPRPDRERIRPRKAKSADPSSISAMKTTRKLSRIWRPEESANCEWLRPITLEKQPPIQENGEQLMRFRPRNHKRAQHGADAPEKIQKADRACAGIRFRGSIPSCARTSFRTSFRTGFRIADRPSADLRYQQVIGRNDQPEVPVRKSPPRPYPARENPGRLCRFRKPS